MRAYISGPMSGLPELNFPAFHAAALALRAKGLDVVNPAEINPDSAMPWEQCMKADIKALCDCDALVMLPGWERSKGRAKRALLRENESPLRSRGSMLLIYPAR